MMREPGSILIFGEALVDDFGSVQVVGGAPFNVARHLAAFRASPLLVTRIGNDTNGDRIRVEFARFGLCADALQRDPLKPTGRVVVERHGDSHRFVIEPDQAYDFIDADAARSAMAASAPATIYFGTLAQRNPVSREALYKLLSGSGAARYLDLNVREGHVNARGVFDSLHQADIVKVNEDELEDLFRLYHHERLTSADMDDKPVRAACAALIRVFDLRTLVVTLGARGAVCFEQDGTMIRARNTSAVENLVDTVGAGDAFSAIFLLGKELGWPLTLTLERANAFAAAICTVPGAVPANRSFYDRWISSWLPA